MIRRPTRIVLATTMGLSMLVASCANEGDSQAVAVLEQVVPSLGDGELYVVATVDGSCRTDCPQPAVSRGWIVDCAEAATDRQAVVGDLEDGGFTSNGGDEYRSTIDGTDIEVIVSSYTNAADGPAPTEEPFVTDPSLLDGRCSVFVNARATR